MRGMETKTIYVVMGEEEGNYGVIAVFDAPELAESFTEDDWTLAIEEYELNKHEEVLRNKPTAWHIIMDKEGDVIEVKQTKRGIHLYDAIEGRVAIWVNELHASIITETKEQAIEMANEQRLKLIELNKWEYGVYTLTQEPS